MNITTNKPHDFAQAGSTASMATFLEQYGMVQHLATYGAFIGFVQRLQEVVLGVPMVAMLANKLSRNHIPNDHFNHVKIFVCIYLRNI